LINILAQDAQTGMRLGRRLGLALALGVLVSAAALLSIIGLRSDILEAIATERVLFKLTLTTSLAAAACGVVFRVGRPGAPISGRVLALLLTPGLLGAAVLIEFTVTPSDSWAARAAGRYPLYCLLLIPALSIPPFTAFMIALRKGAPENPGLAGAAVGLASGSLAAAIYAWHCPDDSPLFVAIWYVAAIGIVTAVGYVFGRNLLRW